MDHTEVVRCFIIVHPLTRVGVVPVLAMEPARE